MRNTSVTQMAELGSQTKTLGRPTINPLVIEKQLIQHLNHNLTC